MVIDLYREIDLRKISEILRDYADSDYTAALTLALENRFCPQPDSESNDIYAVREIVKILRDCRENFCDSLLIELQKDTDEIRKVPITGTLI